MTVVDCLFLNPEIFISLGTLAWGLFPIVVYLVFQNRGQLHYSVFPGKMVIFHILSYLSLALLFVLHGLHAETDEDNERYQMYFVYDLVAFSLFYVLYLGSFVLSDSFVVERRVMGQDKLGEYIQTLCKAIPDVHFEVIGRDTNMCVVHSARIRVRLPCVTDKTAPFPALREASSGPFRLRLSLSVKWCGNAKSGLMHARSMLLEREAGKAASVSVDLVSRVPELSEEVVVAKQCKGLPWCYSLGMSALAGFLLCGLGFMVLFDLKVPVVYYTIVKEISAGEQMDNPVSSETKKTV